MQVNGSAEIFRDFSYVKIGPLQLSSSLSLTTRRDSARFEVEFGYSSNANDELILANGVTLSISRALLETAVHFSLAAVRGNGTIEFGTATAASNVYFAIKTCNWCG